METLLGGQHCSWWRWDLSQTGVSHCQLWEMDACSWQSLDPFQWQHSLKFCGVCGTGNTSSSAFLHAPQGFLLLQVASAESCHGHNAYPKSQCPHSVIPCPSFPLYFLASGLLLSWCAAVCTWVFLVLLREKVKSGTAEDVFLEDVSLPGPGAPLPPGTCPPPSLLLLHLAARAQWVGILVCAFMGKSHSTSGCTWEKKPGFLLNPEIP